MTSSHPLLGLLTGAIVVLSYTGCSTSQVKPGNTPSGSITQPTANQTIAPGQSVNFAAVATDEPGGVDAPQLALPGAITDAQVAAGSARHADLLQGLEEGPAFTAVLVDRHARSVAWLG